MMSFDLINYVLLIVLFINIFLGIILLTYSRRQLTTAYFFVVLGVIFWIASMILYRAANQNSAILWCTVLYVAATCTASPFLYFTYLFSGKKPKKKYILFTFFIHFCILLITLIPGLIITNVQIIPGKEKVIFFGPAYIFYTIYISTYFFLGFINLYRTYKQSIGIQRVQVKLIFFGCFLAANIAMMTNLILPWFGVFQFNWVGQLVSLFMTILTVYAIVKHRLFNIQIQIQKFANIIFPLLASTTVFTSLTIILLHNTIIQPIFIGILALVGNIFLYEFFRRAISKTRLSYVLFQRTYKYQKSLQQLAQEAPSILDLDTLTKRILASLVDEMRIDNVAILINVSPKSHTFELLQSSNYTAENLRAFLQPSALFIDAFSDGHISYVRDEIEYTLHGDITMRQRQQLLEVQRVLQQAKASLIIALRSRQSIMGCIILGEKPKGKPYTTEDIDLLEDISKELAIALVNSKMHQDKVLMTKVLQKEVEKAVVAWKQKSKENEELSRVRSQFIDVTSHQLRTPISVIRNSLLLILEDYLPQSDARQTQTTLNNALVSPEQLEHITHLLNNAFLASENLRSTADNILAASEMIGSNPSVNITQIETADFFDTRVRRARRLFKAKPDDTVQFHVELSPELPTYFVSDEKKISMVLDNLLSNAILYTVAGEVTFSVNLHEQHFVIRIVDTGIGIGKDDQEKLFQRFIRFRNAQRVVPDGNGLGLYLAKEYTELLRGHMSFTSIEQAGTTVTITMPIEYSYLSRARV